MWFLSTSLNVFIIIDLLFADVSLLPALVTRLEVSPPLGVLYLLLDLICHLFTI